MEEYILIKKSKLEKITKKYKKVIDTSNFPNERWIEADAIIRTIKQLQQQGEVVQEVEIDAIRTKHFKDTNQHFNIDKKWTQNWIYNNIKILKTIEK